MTPTHTRAKIMWCESTDSTNSELRRHLGKLDNLSIIAAKRQTAGRGQGDHTWSSEPGQNLTFSILLRFSDSAPLHVKDLQEINVYITSVLLEFLQEEGVTAWVKLPNDIWVEDRKICGILIENQLDGKDVAAAIVGIGLDLNQCEWPDNLPNPVSLKQLTGKEYPLEQTLERISDLCKKNWIEFESRLRAKR